MKMISWNLLVLLGAFIGFTACNRQTERILDIAESCMETHPDSAYRCLLHLEDAGRLSDEQCARYALLLTQATHKCRIPLEDDSLINVAVTHYKGKNDRHQLALSLLYKGLVHKQNHQVEQAVEAFASSEQAFEGVEDNQYKALLFNHYASLLFKQGIYDESLEYYKGAYRYNMLGDSVHYVISVCNQIANIFRMLGMSDSAKVYYEHGLSYSDQLGKINRRNYYLLLQNYATFLLENKENAEAEHLLQECMKNMTDSVYIHTLYSALTSLYYEKKLYAQAVLYGKKALESRDSMILCGGFLQMYKIYKEMGTVDSALHYHNLYRHYHSDIVMRRQTAKVAVIPHKMQKNTLMEEVRILKGWKLWLAVVLVSITLMAWGMHNVVKKRERVTVGKRLSEKAVELGRLKGALSNHRNAVSRMEENHRKELDNKNTEITQLQESIIELEARIQEMTVKGRTSKQENKDLKCSIKVLEKHLKSQTSQLNQVEHQREIDQRIEHFMISDKCESIAVNMLLQLRLDKERETRYDILPSQYLPLLKQLLEQENPTLHEKLNSCNLAQNKLCMCYLIALGLDDVDMMARAACLSPNSVKKYHKECRQLVESLKEEQGNEN